MSRKIFLGLLGVILMIGFSIPVMAEGKGNERKGKYAYKNLYKACHAAGIVDTDKPPVSPDDKTQAQWDRLFAKKDFEDMGCSDQWAQLDEDKLADIHAYLHAHAADSPSPAKCK